MRYLFSYATNRWDRLVFLIIGLSVGKENFMAAGIVILIGAFIGALGEMYLEKEQGE